MNGWWSVPLVVGNAGFLALVLGGVGDFSAPDFPSREDRAGERSLEAPAVAAVLSRQGRI
jgi:hypothetical protein